jgi:hypothetical protein
MLGIVDLVRAGGAKQLRHLVLVEIRSDRQIGEAAKGLKDERDALLFDEPPGLFDGLGRAVAIVKADEVELAAVDPALLVDHLEIGGLGPGDRAVGGSGSAVREALANLDLGIRDPGRIRGPGGAKPGSGGSGGGRERLQKQATRNHGFPHPFYSYEPRVSRSKPRRGSDRPL